MHSYESFNPVGPTVLVTADATAPDGLAVPTTLTALTTNEFRIYNGHATVVAHAAWGADAATAKAKAVVPTGGGANAKHSYAVPPLSVVVIKAPNGSFWSGISASAVSLFITPVKTGPMGF